MLANGHRYVEMLEQDQVTYVDALQEAYRRLHAAGLWPKDLPEAADGSVSLQTILLGLGTKRLDSLRPSDISQDPNLVNHMECRRCLSPLEVSGWWNNSGHSNNSETSPPVLDDRLSGISTSSPTTTFDDALDYTARSEILGIAIPAVFEHEMPETEDIEMPSPSWDEIEMRSWDDKPPDYFPFTVRPRVEGHCTLEGVALSSYDSPSRRFAD